MRISDWSSDVCSSDLLEDALRHRLVRYARGAVPRRGPPRGQGRARADAVAVDDAGAVAGAGVRVGIEIARDGMWWKPVVPRFVTPAKAGVYLSCKTTCSRSEEHTSELQSLMRNSYDVFC